MLGRALPRTLGPGRRGTLTCSHLRGPRDDYLLKPDRKHVGENILAYLLHTA